MNNISYEVNLVDSSNKDVNIEQITMSLDVLPEELLIKIFTYLEVYDLCILKQTCVRFNSIIKSSLHLILSNDSLLTNQVDERIRARSLYTLPCIEKWRITHNWKIGKYKERSLLKAPKLQMPWLNLTKEHVWLSTGKYIRAYKRYKKYLDTQPSYSLCIENKEHICRFVYKQNLILAGLREGGLWLWSEDLQRIVLDIPHSHHLDVISVDLNEHIFVTGSTDKTFKIWPLNYNVFNENVSPLSTHIINERIWCVSLTDNGQNIAVGSCKSNQIVSLNVFDTCSCKLVSSLGKGTGIYDLKWENSQIIWTCGCDMHLRRWDLRTGMCEQSWEDPYLSTLYCLDIDKCYAVLTGCQMYGRVILWDTRKINYVQMYYVESCKRLGRSSPVYCLSFDATNLFVATDQYLNILDFSVKNQTPKNYSDNIFYKQIVVQL